LYYPDITEPIQLSQWLQNIPVNKILLAILRTPHKRELIMMFASGKNQRAVMASYSIRSPTVHDTKKPEGPIIMDYNIK
jgi:hypothetical protein